MHDSINENLPVHKLELLAAHGINDWQISLLNEISIHGEAGKPGHGQL